MFIAEITNTYLLVDSWALVFTVAMFDSRREAKHSAVSSQQSVVSSQPTAYSIQRGIGVEVPSGALSPVGCR